MKKTENNPDSQSNVNFSEDNYFFLREEKENADNVFKCTGYGSGKTHAALLRFFQEQPVNPNHSIHEERGNE